MQTTFTSRFQVGQQVEAKVTAQGMTKGHIYTVVDLHEMPTAFGRFVDYKLVDARNPQLAGFWVGNGHLLLKAV